jgi:hypothetical protein
MADEHDCDHGEERQEESQRQIINRLSLYFPMLVDGRKLDFFQEIHRYASKKCSNLMIPRLFQKVKGLHKKFHRAWVTDSVSSHYG